MNSDADGDSIRVEIELPLRPARAWEILCHEEHRRAWWGTHVELDARIGGVLREHWVSAGREIVTSGRVTRCEMPVMLELTWADDDWPGETTVSFELVPARQGTRLVLRHHGWDIHPENERQALAQAHRRGWLDIMSRLRTYADDMKHITGHTPEG